MGNLLCVNQANCSLSAYYLLTSTHYLITFVLMRTHAYLCVLMRTHVVPMSRPTLLNFYGHMEDKYDRQVYDR